MLKRTQCLHSKILLNVFDDLGVEEAEFEFELDQQEHNWLFNNEPLIVVDYDRLSQVLAMIESDKSGEFYQRVLQRLLQDSLTGLDYFVACIKKTLGQPWLRNMDNIRQRWLGFGYQADLSHRISQRIGFPLLYKIQAKAGSRFPPADPRWFVGATSVVQCLLGQDPDEIEIFVLNQDWSAVDDLLTYYKVRMPNVLAGQSLQLIYFNGITIHVTKESDPLFMLNTGPSVMHCYWQGDFCLTYYCQQSILRKAIQDWHGSFNRWAQQQWLKLGFQVSGPSREKPVWLATETLEDCALKRHFYCKRAVPLAQFKLNYFQGKQHWSEHAKWDYFKSCLKAPVVLGRYACGYVQCDQFEDDIVEEHEEARKTLPWRVLVLDSTRIICNGKLADVNQIQGRLSIQFYKAEEYVADFIEVLQ